MADNLGYTTLTMSLRPPRVAIVFDGGARWHSWARLALHACTNVWGGSGFILVPHHDGEVRPTLLAAARTYDPDYVVRLQSTIEEVENAEPGALRFVGDDESKEQRDQFIMQYGDQPAPERQSDVLARDQVAAACSPHRRRFPSGKHGWDEEVKMLTTDGEGLRSAKHAGLPDPAGAWLSAPPDWGGSLGVAVAARCGAMEQPRNGPERGLEETDYQTLTWLLASHGTPPTDIVRPADQRSDVDPGTLDTAFDRTKRGLVTIGRGFGWRRRALLSVGDDADDFALAYAHQRLYGHGVWLPLSCWASSETMGQLVSSTIRSEVSQYVHRGDGITVATTSVDSHTIDSIVTDLRRPISWPEGQEERMTKLHEKQITTAAIDWPTSGVQYLAIDGQFDQDYAIPIICSENDDVDMVVSCPPAAISHPDLAGCTGLHWQVDIELTEAATPRDRGLDGHALLGSDQDQYLTWIRSGRDGVCYESERYDFIPAGASTMARLARPRFRMPGLVAWANLMATQDGRSVRLSAAGRRVEVMRRLVGNRSSLTSLFAEGMLPILQAFRPSEDRLNSTNDGNMVVLPTGSAKYIWEGYLTFEAILEYGGTASNTEIELRRQADQMLEQGILRRGLILGCAQCDKPAFITVDDLSQTNRCPRCSALNELSQERWKKPSTEPRWYYDLHSTIREHLSQNGEIPLLLSHHLRCKSRHYTDAPELELVKPNNEPLAEADLVAVSDGHVIVAEAKRNGSLGQGKDIGRAVAKRALFAEKLRADQIVLATTDSEWEQASIDALCKEISARPWPIAVPRARLISGLGTDAIHDVEVDATNGTLHSG